MESGRIPFTVSIGNILDVFLRVLSSFARRLCAPSDLIYMPVCHFSEPASELYSARTLAYKKNLFSKVYFSRQSIYDPNNGCSNLISAVPFADWYVICRASNINFAHT